MNVLYCALLSKLGKISRFYNNNNNNNNSLWCIIQMICMLARCWNVFFVSDEPESKRSPFNFGEYSCVLTLNWSKGHKTLWEDLKMKEMIQAFEQRFFIILPSLRKFICQRKCLMTKCMFYCHLFFYYFFIFLV